MSYFRKKPVVVEAITFDELVQHGIEHGADCSNGMPWSFSYKGHPITHENDDCYLIPTLEGTMKFNRGDMLVTGVAEEIYPCKPDIFKQTYERVIDNDNIVVQKDNTIMVVMRIRGENHGGMVELYKEGKEKTIDEVRDLLAAGMIELGRRL